MERKRNNFYLACAIISLIGLALCTLTLIVWVSSKAEVLRLYQEAIAEEGQMGIDFGMSAQEIFSVMKNTLIYSMVGSGVFALIYSLSVNMTAEAARKRWVLMIIVTVVSFIFTGLLIGILSIFGLTKQRELKDSVTITTVEDAKGEAEPQNQDDKNNE